jgi:hypothetical protein
MRERGSKEEKGERQSRKERGGKEGGACKQVESRITRERRRLQR